MKILYLSQSEIPSSSANSIHVMYMCKALSKSHNKVDLVTQNLKKKIIKKNIFKIYNIKKTNKLNINICNVPRYGLIREAKYFLTIIRLIFKNKYDIIYSRNIYASFLLSFLNYKTILELHSPPVKFAKYCFKKILKTNSIKCLITISNNLDKHIKKYFKLQSVPHFVVRDSANLLEGRFTNSKYKILKNSVGYVGSLFKGRGIDLIIQMANQCPENNFYIIGGDNDQINYWKKNVDQKNLFFLGHLDHYIACRLLKKFDILIAPYQDKVYVHGSDLKDLKKSEPTLETSQFMSPLKIFEYMAAKKPIITSDMKVLREFLNHSNSILCDSNNIDQWVRAIKKLNKSKNYKNKIAKKAHYDFLKNFTWIKRAEKILNLNKQYNRILIFNSNLAGGGAENVLRIIANNLADKKKHINLALANKEGEYIDFLKKNINIINFKKKRTLLCILPLIKHITFYKPDIIFSTIINSNILILFIKKILFFFKFKVIIRESNHLSERLKTNILPNLLLKYASNFFYRFSDQIISPTKIICKDLIKNFNVPFNKIITLDNPVDRKEIIKMSQIKIKEKIPKKFLIAIGRLTYQKNYNLMINAYFKFRQKIKDCHLLILGQGPDIDEINKLIKKFNLNKYVHLVGYKKNPFNYLKKSQMLILTSRWEGYPNVLIQGRTLNKKIVATSCFGSSEAVLGKNSNIVRSLNASVFANKMIKVYKSKKKSSFNNISKNSNNVDNFIKLF